MQRLVTGSYLAQLASTVLDEAVVEVVIMFWMFEPEIVEVDPDEPDCC